MSGKGKRRSARLLKLEEQKNDDDSAVCLLDPWQIIRNSISGSSARGKRKRNGDEVQMIFQQHQGEASCSQQPLPAANTSNNLSSQSSVGQIVEYILDELEMRDRHELFAMPDDIQVTDYAERVNRPGDFATLRQKNKDGMYTALEQFENDVYMVFQKAMTMNSQDTVPFREAMSLLNQAKHVFMSLKNNQMYSESELAAWRQRYLDQLQQPVAPARTEGDAGVQSRRATATATAQRTPTGAPRKKVDAEKKAQENGKSVDNAAGFDHQRARQRGGKEKEVKDMPPPGKRIRKGCGNAGAAVRRRLTYNDEKDGSDGAWRAMAMAMPALQGRHVALQEQLHEHTYRESLQRFVRHAGLKARVAAEFRSLECMARARHSPGPQYWSPGAGFVPHGYHHPAAPALPSPADQVVSPVCKLETDELLKLFVLMGTPDAFLERAKQMFGDNKRKEGTKKKGVRKAKAAGAGEVTTDATADEATDTARAGATEDKAVDHARTGATADKAVHTARVGSMAKKAVNHATTDATADKAVDHGRTGAAAGKATNTARAGATADKAVDHARTGATADKVVHTARAGAMAKKTVNHATIGATADKAVDHGRTGAAAGKATNTARAGAMAGKKPAEHARPGATAAKATTDQRCIATVAEESGQKKSSASEAAAAAFGPFAPPKLLPGRLGFGQFASSSSQPFKVKPSTSNSSGKKKNS